MSNIEKNKITFYTFIMSVLVILVHSINNNTILQNVVSVEVCQFAVPSFFILSGFLFFINANNIYVVKNKIKKRIWTLLMPYLMWNVIYYLLNVIFKNNVSFSINELYISAVSHKYNPVYWYLEQLLYITLLTPIIYLLSKNINYLIGSAVFLLLLIFFNAKHFIINYDALLYYIFGAIISKLYNKQFISLINKKYVIPLSISFIIITLLRYSMIYFSINNYLTYSNIIITLVVLNRLIGAIFIFYIIDYLYDYNNLKYYMKNNFFLYSIHYIIVRFFIHIYTNTFLNSQNIMISYIAGLVFYFAMPIICIYVNTKVVKFMKNRMLLYYNMLNGYRG